MVEFIQVPCGLSPPGELPEPVIPIDGGSIDPPGGCECIEGDEECCPPDPPICEDIFIPYEDETTFTILTGDGDEIVEGDINAFLGYTLCDDGSFYTDNLFPFNPKGELESKLKTDTGKDPNHTQNTRISGSIHPLYNIYKMDLRPFPVYGEKNTNLFKPVRDLAVEYVLNRRNHSFRSNGVIGYSLNSTHLKESVHDDIKLVFENIKTLDGRNYDEEVFYVGIKRYLVEDKIDEIDTAYLKNLKVKVEQQNLTRKEIVIPSQSGFGVTSKDKQQSRTITKSEIPVTIVESPNVAKGIKLAYKNAKSLDYRKYTDKNSELLKLWYFIPEDINKRLDITNVSGAVETVDTITNWETFQIITSSGQTVELPINLDDTITFINSDGNRETIPIQSDLDKAYTLNNKDEEETLYNVGSGYKIKMEVSSVFTNGAEFSYATSASLSSHYILKLNTSSLSILTSSLNDYTKVTEANYIPVVDVNEITELIKFKPFPWKVLPIYYDDPIFGHFDFTTNFKFTFTSFSLDSLSSDYKFVRKIPKYIIIMPTDQTKYNIFNHQSVLLDYNRRKITWIHSPDENLSKVGLTNYIFPINFSYPNTGITSSVTATQAMQANYSASTNLFNIAFRDINNKPERSQAGIRSLYTMINRINETYILDNATLTWYDILSRMDLKQFYTYSTGVSPKVIQRFARGDFTGVKLTRVPLRATIRSIDDTVIETREISKIISVRNPVEFPEIQQIIIGGKK